MCARVRCESKSRRVGRIPAKLSVLDRGFSNKRRDLLAYTVLFSHKLRFVTCVSKFALYREDIIGACTAFLDFLFSI